MLSNPSKTEMITGKLADRVEKKRQPSTRAMSTDNFEQHNDTQGLSAKEFMASQLFARTFADGMGLVEEAAAYLDGDGRKDSKDLPRVAALAYAGESMRLTTRLMQVASWLLVQRAVDEGEMTEEEAANEKYRLGAKEICRGRKLEGHDLLPNRLLELLARSEKLYDRVERLDRQLYREDVANSSNAVFDQHNQLAAAFSDLT